MRRLFFLGLSVLAIVCACQRSATQAGDSAPPASVETSLPTAAQPKLKTMKIYLGPAEMEAEVAANDIQRQTGMMFRTQMGENDGMLFVFPVPHQTAFEMKTTQVPLSAAYIDPEGTIREIHDLKPFATNSVVATARDIQYVLETPQGWFQRNKVAPGAVIRTEHGTLRHTFSRH